MTQTMIERVARAICASEDDNDPDFQTDYIPDGPTVPLWTLYEHQARAAIAEMDEPTEAMTNAALALDDGVDWVTALFLSDYNSAQELYADVWKAMHNAALQEGKEEGE